MTLLANSYGTVAGVAAYVPLYTDSGVFNTTTNPTLLTVESWLDQVSAITNGCLSAEGFSIPATQDDMVLAITGVINQHAADLCHASHGTGRFMTERALSFGMSPMYVIRKEMCEWISQMANAWAELGAVRTVDKENQAFSIPMGRYTE